MNSQLQSINNNESAIEFPNGIYFLDLIDRFEKGKIRSFKICDIDLVAYKSENDEIICQYAYCPHLGAYLGDGKVCNNLLVCPFHGWKFNDQGQCVDMPFSKKDITAKNQIFETHIVDEAVFVSINADFEIPDCLEGDGWSKTKRLEWLDESFCIREIIENAVDSTHAPFVHGLLEPTKIIDFNINDFKASYRWDQIIPTNNELSDSKILERTGLQEINVNDEGWHVSTSHVFYGLGFLKIKGRFDDLGFDTLIRLFAVPREKDALDVYLLSNVKSTDCTNQCSELLDEFNENYIQSVYDQFESDFKIWRKKKYLNKPHLYDKDGPINKLRKWIDSRFY